MLALHPGNGIRILINGREAPLGILACVKWIGYAGIDNQVWITPNFGQPVHAPGQFPECVESHRWPHDSEVRIVDQVLLERARKRQILSSAIGRMISPTGRSICLLFPIIM